MKLLYARIAATLLFVIAGLTPRADAYSVLSHEEVVDMAWKTTIVPMLRARFPGITDDQIRQAHAYAYGGSVIQDIGYYPFGSHYFSDLLHYVRPNVFVDNLIVDSTTPDEYAFALGALAHYCGDTIGHPYINQVTAQENPPLEHRFGRVVTYGEDPTAHLRTEFGFDVVQVAQGHYQQQNYRDFIGFQVSKPLLERAFQQTYGMPMSDVIKHEDLAIATYRRAVAHLIPTLTKVAFVSYRKQIEAASPGVDKRKFLYRLDETEYDKEFGVDESHVGVGGHIAAFFVRILPKIGPFKALKVTIPDADEQTVYLKSMNQAVDAFNKYLGEIQAAPAPLPPPDAADAANARQAAQKVDKDLAKVQKAADKAPDDTAKKVQLNQAVAQVQKVDAKANASADNTEAAAAQAANASGPVTLPQALPAGTPVQPPSAPVLAELDMDTGKPANAGEYLLADETYAKLLDDLVHPPPAPAGDSAPVDASLALDIRHFFAHPNPPAGAPLTEKVRAREDKVAAEVKADLPLLQGAKPASVATR